MTFPSFAYEFIFSKLAHEFILHWLGDVSDNLPYIIFICKFESKIKTIFCKISFGGWINGIKILDFLNLSTGQQSCFSSILCVGIWILLQWFLRGDLIISPQNDNEDDDFPLFLLMMQLIHLQGTQTQSSDSTFLSDQGFSQTNQVIKLFLQKLMQKKNWREIHD